MLKEGIVVRYSVSEKVAGHFEVLLASATARKLGLHGASATGLAKGTPAQTVIANAILVTTKGGGSTYKIKFSKATAAKLRKLSRVTLMIRMVVHNARARPRRRCSTPSTCTRRSAERQARPAVSVFGRFAALRFRLRAEHVAPQQEQQHVAGEDRDG